ncbi:7155_t:CDS:1, partial [Gigaspora rosea]
MYFLNEEIYTENNKHVLVVQYEKQAQDMNIANTKIDMIIENGKSPTQNGDPSTRIMNIKQDKQREVLAKIIQVKTNNDAIRQNRMDLE